MKTQITKRIEFDAGHRIPSHDSKCRNFHGHRYVVEATLEGEIQPVRGESSDGMVLDFGHLKTILVEEVHDRFDHGFIVFERDVAALDALSDLGPDHRTIVVAYIPTAENLAWYIFQAVASRVDVAYPGGALKLQAIRVFETPTSSALVCRGGQGS